MNFDNLSPALIRQVLHDCPVGILTLDENARITSVNPALERMLSMAGEQLIGTTLDDSPRPDLTGLCAGDTVVVDDGRGHRRVLAHSRLAADQPDQGASEIHFYLDQTELSAARADNDRLRTEVSALTLVEPTTGLMNQRAIMLALEPQVSRSRRYQNPLAVVMLSVEFAAQALGHEAQTGQLQTVSRLLKDQLRWADLIGRDDGGNFVLVLPETGQQAADALVQKVAERLSAEGGIEAFRFGVAEWSKTDSASSLLQRAGSALSQGRQSGAA